MDGIKDSSNRIGQNYLNDNYNIDPNNDDWNDCSTDGCCDQYEDGYGGCNILGILLETQIMIITTLIQTHQVLSLIYI